MVLLKDDDAIFDLILAVIDILILFGEVKHNVGNKKCVSISSILLLNLAVEQIFRKHAVKRI